MCCWDLGTFCSFLFDVSQQIAPHRVLIFHILYATTSNFLEGISTSGNGDYAIHCAALTEESSKFLQMESSFCTETHGWHENSQKKVLTQWLLCARVEFQVLTMTKIEFVLIIFQTSAQYIYIYRGYQSTANGCHDDQYCPCRYRL